MDDYEKALMEILTKTVPGIENKKVVIRVLDEPITNEGELIEIETASSIGPDGAVQDILNVKARRYNCGCASLGLENFGGFCYYETNGRRHTACKKHYKRCIKCQRPLCINCVISRKGECYCKRCARIKWFKSIFGSR